MADSTPANSPQAAAKLEVLIATYGRDGLQRVAAMNLPAVDGVRYLVCCQNPDGLDLSDAAAPLLERPDLRLHVFADRGSAINRNHAFDLASAPYLLLADDDLRYTPEGLRTVIDTFDSHPGLDIATFRAIVPDKIFRPERECDLSERVRFYSPIMIEIALRREAVERIHLRFSPLTGVNAPALCGGEEDLLIYHAKRKGLRGRYFPIDIVEHPQPTTLTRLASSPRLLRSRGAVLRIIRGNIGSLLRFPLYALRSDAGFFKAMYYFLDGFVYSIKHRKEL